MNDENKIIVGSRKSELALIQTRHVIALLKKSHPDKEFEIVTMSTLGDKVLDIPLPKIGEKSLFTKELEAALITGNVDFVVHSLKDLPTSLPPGMAIGAVLSREDPRDALVLQKGQDKYLLETLPEGSVIGTSSLRRAAQLARKYPHLKVESIRGNLNTRLKKLDELGKYQGIILASAGLTRMGWTSRITKVLEDDDLLYAVGQGALAVECRAADPKTRSLLKPLYDVETALRVVAERSFLKTLGGGCSAPVAVTTTLSRNKNETFTLALTGSVWSLDGQEEIASAAKTTLQIKDIRRCATCPYNNIACVGDIESLNGCGQCPDSPSPSNPSKKQKLDISVALLKEDPHGSCPVQMPIGADFMGKCPYLEAAETGAPLDSINGLKACPFLKQVQSLGNVDGDFGGAGDNKFVHFCGLVSHDDAPDEALNAALKLGENLARELMAKGASEVMAKAQATIHSSIATTTSNAITSTS